MESQLQTNRPETQASTAEQELSTSMRSGTGAPIFEPGPHTRIRRNPVRAIAAMTWSGGPNKTFGQVLNISLTGCLICTETTIETGTELTFSVTLVGNGDKNTYEVSGIVCRTTTAGGRQAYGIEFDSRSRRERETVQALYSATAR